MIDVDIYQDSKGEYTGFQMRGHAEYADYGKDIVCAGVSALVINTINSVEKFTTDTFENTVEPEDGSVTFLVTSYPVSSSTKLLLQSLVLGLSGIQAEYGEKHIKLAFKEKQEV
jgi:hypothetical protein